jgi:hypothetical protein
MLSCLILLRHHDNIQRLWRRQESKIWTRVKKKNARAEVISLPAPPAGRIPAIRPSHPPFAPVVMKGDHRHILLL